METVSSGFMRLSTDTDTASALTVITQLQERRGSKRCLTNQFENAYLVKLHLSVCVGVCAAPGH